MSDVSFGCSGLTDPGVARRAVARGVNYFDTSPDYSETGSERALGEGIRGTPRDKLFLVSKFCTAAGHLPDDTPVPKVIEAVEGSLSRLGTDYLDLVHIHAVNSLDRLMAPHIHEAFDRLKQQGKVRFLGVSSHTPNLEQVMARAVDGGRFDAIMVAYNFKNWPDLTNIFRRAHARGVGVIAMTTLKGALARSFQMILSPLLTHRHSLSLPNLSVLPSIRTVTRCSITGSSMIAFFMFPSFIFV